MSRLEVSGLGLTVNGRVLCRDLQLAFNAGENWAILGANGSGKTTLLHALAGLRAPDAGRVLLDGTDLTAMASRVLARQRGILFQDSDVSLGASVMETVLSGRHPYLAPWQWEDAADIRHAEQALTAMSMLACATRSVTTLSGGERRRVDIAALLAQDAPLCLLDEPLNHLDLRYQVQVLQLLRERAQRPGHLNITVMHDINLAQRYCSHGLLLTGDGSSRHGRLETLLDVALLEQIYGCPFTLIREDSRDFYIPA
jgi:iron complex transport system ATP-binding protein